MGNKNKKDKFSLTKKEKLEIEKQVQEREDDCVIFSKDEKELIACAYKSKLNQIREALKDINIVLNKGKFESKKGLVQYYK